ncbi:MAG TPA: PepSY-like domain-containing protein [Candidatus Cryptobacteroides excrementigallinarum]|nr:PepSY-like domain-containing protein [Candidatus Cryptobacteroides excrementigallinarum]
MRRIVLPVMAGVAVAVAAVTIAVNIESEKPVTLGTLPEGVKDILEEHYAGEQPALAIRKFEGLKTEYELTFIDGTKLEFDAKGQWKEVKSHVRTVPEAFVPPMIREYLDRNFPGVAVMEISRDRKEFETGLSNRVELTFDSRTFMLTDFDD